MEMSQLSFPGGSDMQHHVLGFVLVLLFLVMLPLHLDALPVQQDQHQVVPAPSALLHPHPSLSLLYFGFPKKNDVRSIRSPFSSVRKRAPEIASKKRSWWPKRCFRYKRETKNIKQMKNFLRAAAGPGTCLFNMAFNCDFKNAIGRQWKFHLSISYNTSYDARKDWP